MLYTCSTMQYFFLKKRKREKNDQPLYWKAHKKEQIRFGFLQRVMIPITGPWKNSQFSLLCQRLLCDIAGIAMHYFWSFKHCESCGVTDRIWYNVSRNTQDKSETSLCALACPREYHQAANMPVWGSGQTLTRVMVGLDWWLPRAAYQPILLRCKNTNINSNSVRHSMKWWRVSIIAVNSKYLW